MTTESLSLRESVTGLTMPALRLNESFATQLVHDLDEEAMDAVPGEGHENTPRFTLGHLCMASSMTVWVLEDPEASRESMVLDVPAGYADLFQRMGPGDRRLPASVPGITPPTRDALLAELSRQHDRVEKALREVTDDTLNLRVTWKLSHHLPRVADIVQFQALHEMLHLGQLASWRRAAGLPAAMARMAELRV